MQGAKGMLSSNLEFRLSSLFSALLRLNPHCRVVDNITLQYVYILICRSESKTVPPVFINTREDSYQIHY